MTRKTFGRGVRDFLMGVICGVVVWFSLVAYLIALGLSVGAVVFDVKKSGIPWDYDFRATVLFRVIVINVGSISGFFITKLFFG